MHISKLKSSQLPFNRFIIISLPITHHLWIRHSIMLKHAHRPIWRAESEPQKLVLQVKGHISGAGQGSPREKDQHSYDRVRSKKQASLQRARACNVMHSQLDARCPAPCLFRREIHLSLAHNGESRAPRAALSWSCHLWERVQARVLGARCVPVTRSRVGLWRSKPQLSGFRRAVFRKWPSPPGPAAARVLVTRGSHLRMHPRICASHRCLEFRGTRYIVVTSSSSLLHFHPAISPEWRRGKPLNPRRGGRTHARAVLGDGREIDPSVRLVDQARGIKS